MPNSAASPRVGGKIAHLAGEGARFSSDECLLESFHHFCPLRFFEKIHWETFKPTLSFPMVHGADHTHAAWMRFLFVIGEAIPYLMGGNKSKLEGGYRDHHQVSGHQRSRVLVRDRAVSPVIDRNAAASILFDPDLCHSTIFALQDANRAEPLPVVLGKIVHGIESNSRAAMPFRSRSTA
jgi:hypothetical protein